MDPYRHEWIPAIITDVTTDEDTGENRHGWTEQSPDQSGTYSTYPGARWGTVEVAYAVGLNNEAVSVGTHVLLRLKTDVGGVAVYEFQHCCEDDCGVCEEVVDFDGPSLPWVDATSEWDALDLTGETGVVGVTAGVLSVVDTGTSGHVLPYLDGNNTWSGVNLFTAAFSTAITDAGTTTVVTAGTLSHLSSGTPAAGFGIRLALNSHTSTNNNQSLAHLEGYWVDATNATRKGRFVVGVFDTAERECLRLEASGTAAMVGFLGASASARLVSPDAGTALVTFGLASGTPTFAGANVTGTVPLATSAGTCTGNAATATALATPRTIGGTSFDGTANIVPATITVADTTDSTCFVALWESATGDLGPKSDGGLLYNATTGLLGAAAIPVFVTAGGSAAKGAVPAPGATAHPTQPYILGDGAAWVAHLGLLIATSYVATSETATSTSGTDLTTTQHLTFTLDENCDLWIHAGCDANNSGGNVCRVEVDYEGSDTIVGVTTGTNNLAVGGAVKVAATAGSRTVKMQFSVNASTGTFQRRWISVWKAS